MTIKLWQELISKMDDRSLMDHEVALHDLNSWLGFDQEFKDQGLRTIQTIIRAELDRRLIAWGSVHISLNKGYNEIHDHCNKQIAELQEISHSRFIEISGLKDKLHRRNLQIANQNIEIKNLKKELWDTANELAAVKIQAGIKIA